MFGAIFTLVMFVGVPILSLIAGKDSRIGETDSWKTRVHRGDL